MHYTLQFCTTRYYTTVHRTASISRKLRLIQDKSHLRSYKKEARKTKSKLSILPWTKPNKYNSNATFVFPLLLDSGALDRDVHRSYLLLSCNCMELEKEGVNCHAYDNLCYHSDDRRELIKPPMLSSHTL
jgi:hypothetical protein